jgi:hypothetical protein
MVNIKKYSYQLRGFYEPLILVFIPDYKHININKYMKVENMLSPNGREVINQFIITEYGRGANGNYMKGLYGMIELI